MNNICVACPHRIGKVCQKITSGEAAVHRLKYCPENLWESCSVNSIPGVKRVSLILPNLCFGGVERYHEAPILQHYTKIKWAGCYLLPDAPFAKEVVDWWGKLLVLYKNTTDLINSSDIIITWATPHLDELLQGFKGPVVSICHGDGSWFRAFDQSRATHFVAVSTDAAKAFGNRPVTIMPAGIHMDRIMPTSPREIIRASWGIGNKKAIGFVGRFSDEKNPLLAAKIVGHLGNDYVAVYHGQNPWGEEEFRREATALAQNRIIFLPPSYHTGDVYHGLDCLIQGSKAEGAPLVAIEAWLTNCRMITTNVGIIKDFKHHDSEVMPMDASVEDWARQVVSNPNRERIGTKLAAEEFFSAAAAGKRWENYLCNL